jgi:hypothetical protein
MKHGDKAKAKSAKAASKSSVKSSKAASASKSSSKTGAALKSSQQKTPAAQPVKPAGGNGKGRPTADPSGFSNPIVGSAFKRAIKKFPTAFRRLTD